MANSDNTKRRLYHKRIVAVIFAVLIGLLVAILVVGGISLARYTQSVENTSSANVAAFVPHITYDGNWEMEESITAGSIVEPKRYHFAVTNDLENMPLRVIVELTVEQVLPLDCTLYAGTQRLEPDRVTGNTRIYTTTVQNGETEFALSISWLEGEYDERFNGLTNDVHMIVLCEQLQEGGS